MTILTGLSVTRTVSTVINGCPFTIRLAENDHEYTAFVSNDRSGKNNKYNLPKETMSDLNASDDESLVAYIEELILSEINSGQI